MKIPVRTVIIFSMILLGFFGLLTIISSQSETAMPYFLVLRQLISFAAALGLMFLCSLLPFSFFRRFAAPESAPNAHRWFRFRPTTWSRFSKRRCGRWYAKTDSRRWRTPHVWRIS